MDLQISIFLLFILFTAGHSLSCYNGTNSVNQMVEPCTLATYQCSSTYVSQKGRPISLPVITKGCDLNCQNLSIDFGIEKVTTYCCNTDQCNAQDVPDAFNITNGKQCFSCDGQNCTNIINCAGSEDRCIYRGTFGNGSVVVKGCASKSYCDSIALVSNVVRCCEGNLCNGANSVTLSFLFFCCSLLSYFLLH